MLDASGRESLYTELRRQQPAQVLAYVVGSDEPKTFKAKGDRGRWKRLVSALPAETVRIEFTDAKGAVTWAAELEAEEDVTPGKGKLVGQVDALLQLAHRHAVDSVNLTLKGNQQTLDQLQKIIDTLSQRLGDAERMLGDAFKVMYESYVLAGKAAMAQKDGQPDPSDAMFNAFMQQAMQRYFAQQKKPAAAAAGAAAGAAKPTNGTTT